MSAEVDVPRYAPRPVSTIAWYSPELGAAAVLGAVGVTVAAPVAPAAALPLLAIAARETVRHVRNRQVIAAHWRRIRAQHEQIEPVPVEEPQPESIRATAVRLDRPAHELESGR